MANARHRIWHRAGPAAALAMGSVLIAAAAGCDGSSSSTENTGGGTTTESTTATTNNTGGGGNGGNGGAGGSTGGAGGSTGGSGGAMGACVDAPGSPDPVKSADAFSALDSTPDSTGTNIYFTAHNGASNGEGESGVFGVDANGAITNIVVGAPLAAPLGISISSDDKTLFVTDAAYDVTPGDPAGMRGAILTMPPDKDATPSVLMGTEGFRPRGLDIVPDKDGNDIVYFTGSDSSSDPPIPGLFSIPAGGGAVTKIATDAPFEDPSGVAVGTDKIFVADTLSTDSRFASILVVENGTATPFVPLLRIGYPAGVALSCDEKTLYVSGIDPATESDVILIIDVATKNITPFTNATLAANTDAGGLHRARKSPVFSWADLSAGGTGAVYKVTFK